MEKNYWIDRKQLHPTLSECRVCKTPSEINLLRAACRVTCQGHLHVMRHIQAKMKERQLEALFKGYSYYFGGARHQAYECICASGWFSVPFCLACAGVGGTQRALPCLEQLKCCPFPNGNPSVFFIFFFVRGGGVECALCL